MAGEQIHGARAIIRVDGKVIGDMQSIDVVRRYTQEKKKPLGTIGATEIIITDYDVEFSGEHFRVSGASLIALGMEAKNSTPQSILDAPGLQIEVQDWRTGDILERLKGAKLSEDSRNYSKGQLTMERFSGSALLVTDEFEN